MNQVPIVWRDVDYDYLKSRLSTMSPSNIMLLRDHIYRISPICTSMILVVWTLPAVIPEICTKKSITSIIAGVVARQQEFDIIHAHDWLTYPAGVHAKMVSGKPLCIHVHATDFDRSRGKLTHGLFHGKNGMDYADCIMCVGTYPVVPLSTRIIKIRERYLPCIMRCIRFRKNTRIFRVLNIPKEKVVTFLGRITMQKGPEYFVEAAAHWCCNVPATSAL